jgi:IclR family pca regulon transcriptional regulator
MVEREKETGSEAAGTPEAMKSLRSGLRVLVEFASNNRDLSLTTLAQRCDLSKSQVSKILSALVDSGLIVQDPVTRTYSVGLRAYVLGSRYTTYDELCQAATPAMRELLASTGHSVRLSVLDEEEGSSVYVIGFEGPMFMNTGWSSGNRVPIGASSAGRVMLAFMEEADSKRFLKMPIPALTPYTITDPAKLKQLIAAARRNGYSSQRDETTVGLGVISVPLFGANQNVVGALGLAFPAHVVDPKDEQPLIAALHQSARAISQRMGCAVYRYGDANVPRPPIVEASSRATRVAAR